MTSWDYVEKTISSLLNPKKMLCSLLFCASSLAEPQSHSNVGLTSSGDHESCPTNSPWSCSAGHQDSCCYEGTNGVFLQTQFWDSNPATGPNDSWTIHGLWSDRCGGGYRQFCNPSWEIDDAKSTLEGLGLHDLVNEMSTYWKNQDGSDDTLWTHEFNKHGTCMSTVSPNCYTGGKTDENVGDFFKRVVSLWQSLPSYEWLKKEGIEPSTDKTWTVAEFSDALLKHTNGKTVYLGCDRNNAIYQIWYFFSLKGSVADGVFANIDSISTSSCTDGFKYLPKSSGNGDDGGHDGGDDDGTVSRGYLKIHQSGLSKSTGCVISDGSWYVSGTCATFRIKETIGGALVTSSKGPCNVVDNKLTCGSNVTPGDFEIKDKLLYYDGSAQWSSSSVPSGFQKGALTPDDDENVVVSIVLE